MDASALSLACGITRWGDSRWPNGIATPAALWRDVSHVMVTVGAIPRPRHATPPERNPDRRHPRSRGGIGIGGPGGRRRVRGRAALRRAGGVGDRCGSRGTPPGARHGAPRCTGVDRLGACDSPSGAPKGLRLRGDVQPHCRHVRQPGCRRERRGAPSAGDDDERRRGGASCDAERAARRREWKGLAPNPHQVPAPSRALEGTGTAAARRGRVPDAGGVRGDPG